jgi:hypothetical protein
VANPPCASSDFLNNANAILPKGAPEAVSTINPGQDPGNPTFRADLYIEHTLGEATLAGFYAEAWICSGRGTGAVQEVKVNELRGTLVSGTQKSTAFARTTIMPIANRPWNPLTDSFRLRAYVGGGVNTDGSQELVNLTICNPVNVVVDCCAETLAKLDQIILYVSRAFPPGGLP